MEFLDLFSGIGGFRSALEKAGHTCVGYVEIDKFARKSYQAIYEPKGEYTEYDIKQIKAEQLPKADIWCFGFPCFIGETLIATNKGLKQIRDIRVGDYVLTMDGSFQKVSKTMVKRTDDTYKIKVQGQQDTVVTSNHPYWVRKKQANGYSEPQWIHLKNINKGDLVESFYYNNVSPKEITDEEAWLLGRYIADGYIQDNKRAGRINSYNHKTIFAIGAKKANYFRKHLESYHATESKNKNVIKFIVTSNRLMNLAKDFQRGAINKEVPLWVYGLSNHQRELLLDGAISGDGHKEGLKYIRYTTISMKLAMSLSKLIEQTYYVGVSMFTTKVPETYAIEGRTVNQHQYYVLQFSREQGKTLFKKIDKHFWYPVKQIQKVGNINNVYNLEVERNHTYTANGIIVHNCQDISVAGRQKGFAGNRSSLFFATTRLLRQLKEDKKPKYLVIENVKNLLSINRGWDFAKLQIELDEIGYDCEWDILNTADVLPQHRERIYIVGHLRGKSTRKVFPIRYESSETTRAEIKEIAKVNKDRHSSEGNSILSPLGSCQTLSARSYKDPTKIVVKQVGNIVDTGNFKNPQRGRVYSTKGVSPALNCMRGGGLEPKIAIPVLTPDRINKRQNGRRFKNNEEPEFTLTGQDKHGILDEKMRIRKLTPLECWRLQGFTDEQFYKAQSVNSNSQLYKQAGNSVSVPIVYEIAKRL